MIDFDQVNDCIEETRLEYARVCDVDYDRLDDLPPVIVEVLANKFLQITVKLEADDWNWILDEFVKEKFNVVLIDFKVKYSAYCENTLYEYVYASEGYSRPLNFVDRYDEFEFSLNDYPLVGENEDCRMLTHQILKYLREFDNIGFKYNNHLDNSELKQFLGQCECWSTHFIKR